MDNVLNLMKMLLSLMSMDHLFNYRSMLVHLRSRLTIVGYFGTALHLFNVRKTLNRPSGNTYST